MKETLKKIISKSWIYILLLIAMVIVVEVKVDYHMDEIYSYGLANNVGHTSIHPYYAPYTYENPADIYMDYMLIEDGEGFDIANCWYNQERESSPPLYYFSVHVVSAIMALLAGERFTRWTAASINLVYMILTLWVFRKILEMFDVKEKKKTLFSLYFILSPAILSIVSFFRMYNMAIFFATLITYLVLKYRNHENIKFYIFMIIASICAVLTQYYLIFYLFFISLVYGIYLLYKKEWLKAGKYIVTMGIAGGLTIAIFPGIINHLFTAGRGTEGIENFQKGFDVHWTNIKEYCEIMNKQLFGNLFWILIAGAVILLVYGTLSRRKAGPERGYWLSDTEKIWDVCILLIPVIGYILIVAKVAPYNTDRYVMAVFGDIIVMFLLTVDWLVRKCLKNREMIKNLIIAAVCVVVMGSIWKDFRWPYLYRDMKEHLETMESYSDVDGLCVLSVGWRITGNFNEIIKLNSMTFFQDDISELQNMQELKNKDEFILYVVDNDADAIIERIFEICPNVNESEFINKSDSAYIYHLYYVD